MKTLKRSDKNKVFAGVFGGIGEYLEVDPTLLRLVGLFLLFYSGIIPFLLVYLVAIFVVPKSEERIKADEGKPVYKKGWFWIVLVLGAVFILMPVLAFVVFRFNSDVTIEEMTNFEEVINQSMEESVDEGSFEEVLDIEE